MISIGGRSLESFSILAAGNPLEDTLLIIISFSLVFWFIGLGSGYALTRVGNFIAAVLPSGLIIILLQLFDSRGNTGVILTSVFIFLVVLLLGRMNYSRRREAWHSWRVFPTGDTRTDINLTILISAVVLVLIAWLLPVSSRHIPIFRIWWQDMSRLWERNENLTNLFAGLQVDEGSQTNNFYGAYLPLGDDAPTSDLALFHIQNNGTESQKRYYWRVRSYDAYEDGLWTSSSDETRDFTALSPELQIPENTNTSTEFRLVVIKTKFGALITPSRPTWVDRPSRLTYQAVDETMVEPIIFQPNIPVQPGEEYLIHAILLEPTAEQLRNAGTEYPDWVTKHYLQLPSDLPPAIINLAYQITKDEKSPYDKAEAITSFLRREIEYTTHIETPPVGRSILSWFLFDYRQGFCNYYATAEVILLRTLGIPARMTVGFSEGEFEMPPGWYTVRQQNAHAWPEVFFPGVGWVEFEPTTTEPELVRSQGEITGPEVAGPDTPPESSEPPEFVFDPDAYQSGEEAKSLFTNWQNSLILLLFILVGSIQAGITLSRMAVNERLHMDYQKLRSTFSVDGWRILQDLLHRYSLPVPKWLERQAWMKGLSPLEREFQSIYRALRQFKSARISSLTPKEAANELLLYLPEAKEEISILLEEYQPATYRNTPPDMNKVLKASASLRIKARHAQPIGWRNRHMNRSKFVELRKEIND